MSQYTFKFIVMGNGIEEDCFTLLNFNGEESISTLFNFECSLRCNDLTLNEDDILNQQCRLEIYFQQNSQQRSQAASKPMRVIHGMVNEFEDVDYYPDHTLYQAKVVPRVWQLGLFETNEVYLDQTIEETLTVMLEEADFINNQDFRFAFNRTYRKWPFRLQYNETHLDFLQRIIEREGIYYYFEQSEHGEVMVFCDHNQALPKISSRGAKTDAVLYQTSGALNVTSHANTLTTIICKRQSLPKKITLRDFNDETPSLDIRGEKLIDDKGIGEINLYGLNIMSPDEGEKLAEIHANAYICRHKSYSGEGDIATMAPGHTFKIENHPRPAFNQSAFLLESILHEGANLVEGANTVSSAGENSHPQAQVNYSNTFSALSAECEFAPQRQTVTPEIKGTLNAVIDSEADSGYAELDDSGRYKVKLPFDRKDRDGGKASHWVRMMQPYGGVNEGMHFPLLRGTQVLLGFIGGDPDRPFISGTINDSGDQQSIVTAENQTNNLIKTASGNKIELEDKEGENRIKLQTGDDKTYMHLGSPNHPGDGLVIMTKGMERKEVIGGQQIFVAASDAEYENAVGATVNIPTRATTINEATAPADVINEQEVCTFYKKEANGSNIAAGKTAFSKADELAGRHLFERRIGDVYKWTAGNEYNYGGGNEFNFGNSYSEVHTHNDGIDNSDKGLQYGNSKVEMAKPDNGGKEVQAIPSSLKGAMRWEPGDHEVEKKWIDTFSYQKGHNYGWGDTCDYEFGNGYAEGHVDTEKNPDGTPWSGINFDGWSHDCYKPGAATIKSPDAPVQVDYTRLTLTPGDTGVEKSFGDTYEYSQGNSIEVSYNKRGEEYTYGGESYEAKYKADGTFVSSEHAKPGRKTEISRSLGGAREEKEIVDITGVGKVTESHVFAYGNPVSYEIVREPAPGTKFSFKGDGLPTLEMEMVVDVGETKLSTHLGVMSNEVKLEVMGMSNSMCIEGALMENSFKMSKTLLETIIEFDGLGLKDFESNLPGLKIKSDARKLRLENEATLKLKNETLNIITEKLKIAQGAGEIKGKQFLVYNSLLSMLG